MLPFQTLHDFIQNPFGITNEKKSDEYEKKYQAMKKKSNFKIEGYTSIDDNYFIHVIVPSDSNQNQTYDVVVLFFTDETVVKKRTTFSNYYVKFFSNSPSFIYKYAYLYKENGFLIDFLFDKLDAAYIDKKPLKTNSNFDMFYEKSIYCASRLLLDDEAIALSKLGIILKHKKPKDKFFRDIKSFEHIKMNSELQTIDKKINKELEENKKVSKSKPKPNRTGVKRITSKPNTLSKGTESVIRNVKKKSGGNKISPKKSIKKR